MADSLTFDSRQEPKFFEIGETNSILGKRDNPKAQTNLQNKKLKIQDSLSLGWKDYISKKTQNVQENCEILNKRRVKGAITGEDELKLK